MEMDFHGMKRKALQALCKKHRLPANVTNLEMADSLAALLKVDDETKTKGSSSPEESGEIAVEDGVKRPDDPKIIEKAQKKVTFHFDEEQTAKMLDNQRNPDGKLPPKKRSLRASLMKSELQKAQVDCTGELGIESVVEMKEICVPTTRSRAGRRSSEAIATISSPVLGENKKARKEAKLENRKVDVDKPPPVVERDKVNITRGVARKVSGAEDGMPVTRSLKGLKVLPGREKLENSEGTRVVLDEKENSPRKTRRGVGERLKNNDFLGEGDFGLSKNSRKTRSQKLMHVEARDAIDKILPADEFSDANSETITQKVGPGVQDKNEKHSQPEKARRRSKRNAAEVESLNKDGADGGGDVGVPKNSRWTRSQKLKTDEAKDAGKEILPVDEGSCADSENITRKSGAEVREESGRSSRPERATRRSKCNASKVEQIGEIVQRNNPQKRSRDQGPEVLHVSESGPGDEVMGDHKRICQFEESTRRQAKLNALKSDLSAATSKEKGSHEKIRRKDTQNGPRKEDLKQSASEPESKNRSETGSRVQEEIRNSVQLEEFPRRSKCGAHTNETCDPGDENSGAKRKGGKAVQDDGETEDWGRPKHSTHQTRRANGRKVVEVAEPDTKLGPHRDAEVPTMEPEENSAEPLSILSKQIPGKVKQKLHSGMKSGKKRQMYHGDMRSSIQKNSTGDDQRAVNPNGKAPTVKFGLNEVIVLGEETLEEFVTVEGVNLSSDQKVQQVQESDEDLSVAKEEKEIQSGREKVLEERTPLVSHEDQVIGLCMDADPQDDAFNGCEMENEILEENIPAVGMESSVGRVSSEGKKCDTMNKNESTQSPSAVAVAEAENETVETTIEPNNGETEILEVGVTETASKNNFGSREESSPARDFGVFPIFDCKSGHSTKSRGIDLEAAAGTDSEAAIVVRETTGTVSDYWDADMEKTIETVPGCIAYMGSEGSAMLGDAEIPKLVCKQTPGCVKALELDPVGADQPASPGDNDIPPAPGTNDYRNRITQVLDTEYLDQEFEGEEQVKDYREEAAAEDNLIEFACENGNFCTFPEDCSIECGDVNGDHKVVKEGFVEAIEAVAEELTQYQDNDKEKDNSEQVTERRDDTTMEMASFEDGEKGEDNLSMNQHGFEIEMGTCELSSGINLLPYPDSPEEQDSLGKGIALEEKESTGNDEGEPRGFVFKDSNFVCENGKDEELDKLSSEAASPAKLHGDYDSPMENDEMTIGSDITQVVERAKETEPVQELAEMADEMRTIETVIEELEFDNNEADLEPKIMEQSDPEEIKCKDCEEVVACREVCDGSAAQEELSFGENEVVEGTENVEYIDKNSGSESNGEMLHTKERKGTTIEVAVLTETEKESSEVQGKKQRENADASASSSTSLMPILAQQCQASALNHEERSPRQEIVSVDEHEEERNSGQVKFAMQEDSTSRKETNSISGMHDIQGEDCSVHEAVAASETVKERVHFVDNVDVEVSSCKEKTMPQQVISIDKYEDGRTSRQVQFALQANVLSSEKAIIRKDYDEGGEHSCYEAAITIETLERDESLLSNAEIGISSLGKAPEGSDACQTETIEQSDTIRLDEHCHKECREGLLEMIARVAPRGQDSLAHNTFLSDDTTGKEANADVELFCCRKSLEGAEAMETEVIEESSPSEVPQSVVRRPVLEVFQETMNEEAVTPVAIETGESSPHEALDAAQITGENECLEGNAGFEQSNSEKEQSVVRQLILNVFEETLKVEAMTQVGMERRHCVPHEARDATRIMGKEECLVDDANVTSKSGEVPEAMQTEQKEEWAIYQAPQSVVGEHIVEVVEETLKMEAVIPVAMDRAECSPPGALNDIEIMGEDRCLVSGGNVEMSRYGHSLVVAGTMLSELKEDSNAYQEPGSIVREPGLEVLKETLNKEAAIQILRESGESSPLGAPDAAEIMAKDKYSVVISGITVLNSTKVHEVEGAKENELEEESGRVLAAKTSLEEIYEDSEENFKVEAIAQVAQQETCPEDHQDVLEVDDSIKVASAEFDYKDSEVAEEKENTVREVESYCNHRENVPDKNKNANTLDPSDCDSCQGVTLFKATGEVTSQRNSKDSSEFPHVMAGQDNAEAVPMIDCKDTEVAEEKEHTVTETVYGDDGEDVIERSTSAKDLQKADSDGCKGVALSKVIIASTSQRDHVDPTEFSEVEPAAVVSPLKPQIGAYNCAFDNSQGHSRFELVMGSNTQKISESSTVLAEVKNHAEASTSKSESGLNNSASVNVAALPHNASECHVSCPDLGQYSPNKQIVEVDQHEEDERFAIAFSELYGWDPDLFSGYDVHEEEETSVQNYGVSAPSREVNELLKNGGKAGEVAQTVAEEISEKECKENENIGAMADFKEVANANADKSPSPPLVHPAEYGNERKCNSLSSTEVANRQSSETAERIEEYKVGKGGDMCGSFNTSVAIKDGQICAVTSELRADNNLEAQVEEITGLFNESFLSIVKAEKKASRTQYKPLKPVNSLKHWANTTEMKENTPVVKKDHPSIRKVVKSATPISKRRPLENLQSSRKREETFRSFNN